MDREKVIKGLDRCKEGGSCDGCQYDIHSSKCIFLLHADAIALLKEQEATIEELKGFINGFSREAVPVVRCKDCKHRPKEPNWETYESGWDIEFPEGSKCPCQCSSDTYYSWYPEDDWFCADGERRTEDA